MVGISQVWFGNDLERKPEQVIRFKLTSDLSVEIIHFFLTGRQIRIYSRLLPDKSSSTIETYKPSKNRSWDYLRLIRIITAKRTLERKETIKIVTFLLPLPIVTFL